MPILLDLLRHWRLALLGLAALVVISYYRSAESAKTQLAQAQARAALADSIAKTREAQSAVLGASIDSLREEVKNADILYSDAVARLRKTPIPPGFVTKPGDLPDTTKGAPDQEPQTLFDLPEVQAVLAACDERVAERDQIILRQDLRRMTDSLTIVELRMVTSIAPIPVTTSRIERTLLGAAVGLVGGMAGQQLAGEKGLIVGASLGALIGYLR
jgi:hypothetical protein